MDRGAWRAVVRGVTESQTRLNTAQHRKHVLVERTPSSGSHFELSGQFVSRVSDLSSAVAPSHEHTHTHTHTHTKMKFCVEGSIFLCCLMKGSGDHSSPVCQIKM